MILIVQHPDIPMSEAFVNFQDEFHTYNGAAFMHEGMYSWIPEHAISIHYDAQDFKHITAGVRKYLPGAVIKQLIGQ